LRPVTLENLTAPENNQRTILTRTRLAGSERRIIRDVAKRVDGDPGCDGGGGRKTTGGLGALIAPAKPMLATRAPFLPLGPAWTYEVKWDGYRTLVIKNGPDVRLISRSLKNVTKHYPAVALAARKLRAQSALLDGELVALDPDGRPSFQALQHRATSRMRIVFYAFDLLHVDGRDLMKRPLEERRTRLRDVIAASDVWFSESLPGTPGEIERAVRGLGLEGVVAKRRDSTYTPGLRSPSWLKIRFSRRQEFVVGGYKPAGANFDSLLVGYFERRKLFYAGKVRAGFTPALRGRIFSRLAASPRTRCPFVNLPNSIGKSHWGEGVTEEDMKNLRWVQPKLVVEVAFVEWTAGNNLRHASFLGLREDKAAADVRRET
jgi:bifunctional non-homologous end joining protein LigD